MLLIRDLGRRFHAVFFYIRTIGGQECGFTLRYKARIGRGTGIQAWAEWPIQGKPVKATTSIIVGGPIGPTRKWKELGEVHQKRRAAVTWGLWLEGMEVLNIIASEVLNIIASTIPIFFLPLTGSRRRTHAFHSEEEEGLAFLIRFWCPDIQCIYEWMSGMTMTYQYMLWKSSTALNELHHSIDWFSCTKLLFCIRLLERSFSQIRNTNHNIYKVTPAADKVLSKRISLV